MTANQKAPQQSLISDPTGQRHVTNTGIHSFDLRHYSLDGPGESPGGYQSSSASRSRRSQSTRDETHSPQSTRQRSSDSESSQLASPPPQIPQTRRWQLLDALAMEFRRRDERSSQALPFPSSDLSWDQYVSDDSVTDYRAIGAQYQAWIAGRSTTTCPIRRSRVTWGDLINHPLQDHSFEVHLDENRSTPEEAGSIESTGLSTGNDWRYVYLRQYRHSYGDQEGWTVYQHRTGLGAIFVENITRRSGPYWSQVAQAQYQLDNHIDTLRYVYFINVQNLHTWPYVEIQLYPRHGLHWFNDHEPQRWAYGTREYQELLGTKLGEGVARLVLGAWPTGTHRIHAIHTWTIVGNLQMRFDIKQI
ncbi:hypothetical protein N7517_003458 [Penicillium concentricum]|uniref:Uncharacterized protein n=1 Tax=Penicillium concentricum TaxID=293559 RepID=A0A9W9VLW9_9EURO|nr:uncharacterized protein N7517_003458 [Penicillium concentricum]KAJ5385547.1 hypothetical protein N7517_003458 [Penicillium concentricum]